MKQVLLIEDQTSRFNTIITRLESFLHSDLNQYQLKTFNNWKIAFDYYKKNHSFIELVILDIRMPQDGINPTIHPYNDKTTGIELLRKIREISEEQKFIFWSVLNKKEIEDQGFNLMDENYVNKNSSFEDFFSKIDSLINTNMLQKFEELYYKD